MANGLNAILGGFKIETRFGQKRFFTQYFVAIGISLVLSLIDSNGSDCNF
jgi:hypothetical protein